MYLLDTNVISELRKAKSAKADKNVIAWANSIPGIHLYISVITVLELETGVLQIERCDPAHGSILRLWLDTHVMPAFSERIISIDTIIAQACAKLHVPNQQPDRDSLIAATALVHDLIVVTRNTRDFTSTGVKILNPWLF